MDPLITAWTDRHTRVALLLVVVVVAMLSGLREEWQVAAVVGATVVLACTVALVLDQFGGVAVGIIAAALLTGGRQLLGLWDAEDWQQVGVGVYHAEQHSVARWVVRSWVSCEVEGVHQAHVRVDGFGAQCTSAAQGGKGVVCRCRNVV